MNILIISMFTQRALIEALVNAGISGYILKDDQSSIQQLDKIVRTVANGGIYFSEGAYLGFAGRKSWFHPHPPPVGGVVIVRLPTGWRHGFSGE